MPALLEILQKTADYFASRGVESPRLNAELLLGHVLGLPRMQLYLQFERPLAEPELERLRPEPALFPPDPQKRAAVEEAERFGDEQLQHPVRQTIWWAFRQNKAPLRSYSEGARLGIPIGLAVSTATPIIALETRIHKANEENVRAAVEATDALNKDRNMYVDVAVKGTGSKLEVVKEAIPRGRVATYGQVAALAGFPGQARLVGYALAALPSTASAPWHRVVNARGRISRRATPGYEAMQRTLLEAEGIAFSGDDIALARWPWRRGRRRGR